ncbi:MAG: hypothetical protein KDK70_07795 [Myxococcales bacterium]|nr:hypothetical protein [Myxococcales bacterium]
MRRVVVWGALALVLAVAAAVWLLPRWLGSDAAKAKLEAILSEALGRPVSIESLEVGADAPVVDLYGVTVAQPPELVAPDGAPLLWARHVRLEVSLDQLLARQVVGSARAEGVVLVVLERGGHTSVHGLGPRREGRSPRAEAEAEAEPLALDVELEEVALRLVDLDRGEALEARDVALRGYLSAQPGDEREAAATLTAEALEVGGVTLRELMAQLRLDDAAIALVRLHARLGAHGTLEGRGTLGAGDGSAQADAEDRKRSANAMIISGSILMGVLTIGGATMLGIGIRRRIRYTAVAPSFGPSYVGLSLQRRF